MTWCNATPGRTVPNSALFPGIGTPRRIRVLVMATVTHAYSFDPVFKVLSFHGSPKRDQIIFSNLRDTFSALRLFV